MAPDAVWHSEAMRRARAHAAEPEETERALRLVATAVAAERPPAEVFAVVAREAAGLADADSAGVVRFDGPMVGTVVGQHGVGTAVPWSFPLSGSNTAAVVARTGAPSRVDDLSELDEPTARHLAEGGQRCGVGVPVRVGAILWGAIVAGSATPRGLRPDATERLTRFAELVTLAIGNTEAREQLRSLAQADPLTDLPNHRVFHERLRAEVGRAQRHGAPLALVVLDVDHFKQVNDERGHLVGDRLLTLVARALARGIRTGELVARVGGDEFAVIAPESDGHGGHALAERLRGAVSLATAEGGLPATMSAGVASLEHAVDATELFRVADGALYWAKEAGRDACVLYEPDVVGDLSAAERAQRLERARAVVGLQALARALDARDASTAQHSERVADLAQRLAQQFGWTVDRTRRLREAGLLHDVGKLAVPDAVLLKPGRLTPEEYAQVQQHPVVGARMVVDVLDTEQTAWIRGHHERPDGQGYPDGLEASAIPDGARILAVADAFDAMTMARPYGAPLGEEAARAVCRRLAGRQFDPDVVRALAQIVVPSATARLAAV